jgi:hypothetical protein
MDIEEVGTLLYWCEGSKRDAMLNPGGRTSPNRPGLIAE